jgi:hypothetical protein
MGKPSGKPSARIADPAEFGAAHVLRHNAGSELASSFAFKGNHLGNRGEFLG